MPMGRLDGFLCHAAQNEHLDLSVHCAERQRWWRWYPFGTQRVRAAASTGMRHRQQQQQQQQCTSRVSARSVLRCSRFLLASSPPRPSRWPRPRVSRVLVLARKNSELALRNASCMRLTSAAIACLSASKRSKTSPVACAHTVLERAVNRVNVPACWRLSFICLICSFKR